MGIVNVSDFKRRAFSVKTAGTERGKFTLVRQFRNRVRLIHKLGKLRRTEKFADHRRYGRILMSPEAVTSIGSCVAILSLISLSRREIPTCS